MTKQCRHLRGHARSSADTNTHPLIPIDVPTWHRLPQGCFFAAHSEHFGVPAITFPPGRLGETAFETTAGNRVFDDPYERIVAPSPLFRTSEKTTSPPAPPSPVVSPISHCAVRYPRCDRTCGYRSARRGVSYALTLVRSVRPVSTASRTARHDNRREDRAGDASDDTVSIRRTLSALSGYTVVPGDNRGGPAHCYPVRLSRHEPESGRPHPRARAGG